MPNSCTSSSTLGFSQLQKFCSLYVGMTQTHPLTTTTFELPGYRVVKSFGVVRGIIVRSRSIVGNIGAGLQSLFGGNISLYTSLCERAREDAFNDMISHAGQLGANALLECVTTRPRSPRESQKCFVMARPFMSNHIPEHLSEGRRLAGELRRSTIHF